MNNNWRNLAAAIINTAMTDREKALARLEMNPENKDAESMLKDCDRFLSSSWCALLLDFLNIERETFLEAVYGR